MRYLMFALPLLLVLAATALRSLPWRAVHLWTGLAALAAFAFYFARDSDDGTHLRRFILLRLSLVLALLIVVAAHARRLRPLAPWAVAVGAAFSIAVTVGVDLRAMVHVRSEDDAALDDVAGHAPAAFALVGFPRQIDPVLALDGRDVEYGDLYETSDWSRVRALVAHWQERGRPVFALPPPEHAGDWFAGLSVARVASSSRLWRVESLRGR
jgi:hypothetical protein